MEVPPDNVQKANANLLRRIIGSKGGQKIVKGIAKGAGYCWNQIKSNSKELFVEGPMSTSKTTAKLVAGGQLIYSGYVLAYGSLAGKSAEVVAKLKESVFIQDLAYSLIRDGQSMGNLDQLAIPALVGSVFLKNVRTASSAKINKLINELPQYEEAKGGQQELVSEYKPTKGDYAKAIARSAVSELMTKIPKYVAAAYATTLAFQTDVISMVSIFLNRGSAEAKQAIAALQDVTTNPVFGTMLGVWAILKGIAMLKGKG